MKRGFTTSATSIKTKQSQRTSDYGNDYWRISASTGTPRYYARKNNTSIFIVPTPASTLTGEIQTDKLRCPCTSTITTTTTITIYYIIDATQDPWRGSSLCFLQPQHHTDLPLCV